MTMTTKFRALDKIDVHEFFRYGQSVLAERDTMKRKPEEHIFSDEPSYWKDGSYTIANQLGQDLPGIWDVDYRPDGPLRAEDALCDKYCEDDCNGRYHPKACYVEASIDTSYSYQDDHGGVGNLHAWFIAQLMNWCDERSVRYAWYNESRGEWFTSAEDLVTLCESGVAAQEWFSNIVKPVIEAEAARTGAKVEW